MDVLEKTVKKSISQYRNKKRNSPQNDYDDADYYYDNEYNGVKDDNIGYNGYYDDEYYGVQDRIHNPAIHQGFPKWDQQWSSNHNKA